MASTRRGYDEKRFVNTVNRNFLCLICFNVLKDPVLCPKNHHCFCRGCITKYLENSRRCPTCADELTEETLTEPNKIVKDYLNESNIRCVYNNRGCQEIVQLQHLERHEDTCGFTPAVCTNPGCGTTLNKRDLIHHESELCEYRMLKCHSCGEMTKTVTGLKNRITNVERKMGIMEKQSADTKEQLKEVNSGVRDLKAALIECFDEMKDFLVKMNDMKAINAPSRDGEKIIVAGGLRTNSVEMFNWRQRIWSPLQSMPEKRFGATSFVYNNQVVIAGGCCDGSGRADTMIRMNVDPQTDLSTNCTVCRAKLPAKLAHHSSVLYDDKLIVTGGHDGNATSDKIHEVQVVPTYTVKTLSRMPEARQGHCTEIFDDSLLILGGKTTERYQDNLSSVLLYDIKNNVCKQLAPLPYEVSLMATVRWGDNVVVIGGIDKRGKKYDTVIMYNVKTQQSHMLPPMRCKRCGCAAVAIGQHIVVLGGVRPPGNPLKSAEAFSFESNTWQELPEMSEARWLHTAVAV